jgi:lipopolysaccharide-induced tumor necrosis factor-alpha factor
MNFQQLMQPATAIMGSQQQTPNTPMFGKVPVETTCSNCKNQVVSKVEKKIKEKAYWLGLLLCAVGCDLGCCLIPCCLDSMKIFHHTCPDCKGFMGKYEEEE